MSNKTIRRANDPPATSIRHKQLDTENDYKPAKFNTLAVESEMATSRPTICMGGRTSQSRTGATPSRILFVCTGNTCRSPMAEGLCTAIAHKLGLLEVQATSAGIAATEGSFPSPHAASVMREMGIAISKHRARQLNSEMAHHVDLILAMTPQHVKQALAIVGAAVPVRTLGDYAGVREAMILSGELLSAIGESSSRYSAFSQ